jgi:Fur family ferric uptake transcriptional regulator
MQPGALLPHLRERGWRVTPQRRAVVTVLERGTQHATAEEVHAAAQLVVPEISLATVYNVLTELVAMGEISEVRLGPGAALFETNVTFHYHHVCDDCGRVADVPAPDMSACLRSCTEGCEMHGASCDTPMKCCLKLPELATRGYSVDRIEIIFRGHCGCTTT